MTIQMGERLTHTLHTLWPEEWPRLSKKHKQEEIEEETRQQNTSRRRGIFDVESEDAEHFKVISEARAKLVRGVVPSMPGIHKEGCTV